MMVNGEPWSVAADVCGALDNGNPAQALTILEDDEKDIISNDTLGGVEDGILYIGRGGGRTTYNIGNEGKHWTRSLFYCNKATGNWQLATLSTWLETQPQQSQISKRR